MRLSPLDEAGKPVDWWFVYKAPRLGASNQTAATTGFEYVYFDSAIAARRGRIAKSPHMLNAPESCLKRTLEALFRNPGRTTGWILYNDEVPPNGPVSSTLGHTKGVLGFDLKTDTAFWLLHSWPKFTLPNGTAEPSRRFGQTYLCLAIDLNGAEALAEQMRFFQEPQVYLPRIPPGLAASDALRLLTGRIDVAKDPASAKTLRLRSRGNKPFRVIAKDRNWGKDFWIDLVAQELPASLDVDTWVRGHRLIPPQACNGGTYRVEDVKYITFEKLGLPWAWPETRDHAKWAVSEAGQGNWICVGDINRMITQRRRGGCTIAFRDNILWTMLSQTDKLVLPAGVSAARAKAGLHRLAREAKRRQSAGQNRR